MLPFFQWEIELNAFGLLLKGHSVGRVVDDIELWICFAISDDIEPGLGAKLCQTVHLVLREHHAVWKSRASLTPEGKRR